MAASISGSHSCCYSSPALGRGSRRRCTTIRSSFTPCSPASSKSSTTSLRIGRKWAELQGARDWDGLLSPLDGALSGELVRYGAFVRAAYASFDSSSAGSPSYGSCRFPIASLLRRAGLPETGYHVTRILHAAASTSAPCWLSLSSSCSSSYIGFVAVCDDEAEIERLGRRDVVVAFRGTATRSEWVDNLQSGLTRLPSPRDAGEEEEDDEEEEPMVETGFWRLFTSPGEAHCSLQEQVRGEVERIVHEYGGDGSPPLSVTVTGHSLGAALAVLAAYEITTSVNDAAAPMVTAVSFGGPRVGNAAFRRRMEESGGKVLRVVNSNDIVTKVPGFPVDDDDCVSSGESSAAAKRRRRRPRVPRWLVAKMGWAYSDVGRELRLCSKDASSNVVASHDLDLYLKLVAAACTSD